MKKYEVHDVRGMQSVKVSFVGGILDGSSRVEILPGNWSFVRFEKSIGDSIHVYVASILPGRDTIAHFSGIQDK